MPWPLRPARTSISRPVHRQAGLPALAMGASAMVRQVFATGSKAAPSVWLAFLLWPPQSSISRPFQTAAGAFLAVSGPGGSFRQVSLRGS